MDSNLIPYQPVISDIKNLIAAGQNVAYNAANRAMIMTYWNIGKRIVEEEQSGAERAEYGKRLISILSDELTKEFGSNYSGRSLRYYRKFYLCFPDFEIWNTRVPNLNWSHFRALLRVPDEDARVWYMNEAANENWSVRTLDRNIGTQYYYRLLHSPKKEAVIAEMKEKTAAEPKHQFELLKSPIVAEFLGFRTEDSHIRKKRRSKRQNSAPHGIKSIQPGVDPYSCKEKQTRQNGSTLKHDLSDVQTEHLKEIYIHRPLHGYGVGRELQ